MIDPSQFLSALLAIVVIDIVLAGDNAIVIALAARGLPAHLQKRAIVWGAIGAIGVRSVMTVIVVWLLQIPGLMLIGGALLLWIAYRLMLPDQSDGAGHGAVATGFWSAMRTIVIADAVMGLDNVLAVAGAAHGSYVLVVTGLLISVPIVMWGSSLVLKLVDRFPAVVYVGAGVLVFTAVSMMRGEGLLKPWLDEAPWLALSGYLLIPLLLWVGFSKNHRHFESRIHARLAQFADALPARANADVEPLLADPTSVSSDDHGVQPMLKVLVPVDGSVNALHAIRHVIAEYGRRELEVHLVNVQPSLSRHIARFISRRDRQAWHHDQAQAAMAGARAVLAGAGVPHHTHIAVGARAEQICRLARELAVHHIVIGTARKNSLTRMLEDSATHRLLETTPVPVEVVVGEAVSKWERWGLPAGAAALTGGLMLLAAD